jgi:hypothetical protein
MDEPKINLMDGEEFQVLKEKFINWYLHAEPYEWFTYHHGVDLHTSLVVEIVRNTTWTYATKGLIYLFQKRDQVDKRKWFFMCQKSKKPLRRLVPKPTKG